MPSSTCFLSLAKPLLLSAHKFNCYKALHAKALATSVGMDGALDRLKHPGRGGQNLSARYARLERSLRGKEVYLEEIGGYRDASVSVGADDEVVDSVTTGRRRQPQQLVFRGFVVPEEPKAPQPDECCMSGCAVCVHDLYQESLEAYEASIKSLRTSLTTLGVVESEWPVQIQMKNGKETPERKKDVALSAFEQMELQLAAKHQKKTSVVDVDGETVSAPSSSDTGPSKKKQNRPNAIALLEAINWVVFSRR